MNYYIVCEGEKTELIVYKSWIPSLNSSLTLVNSFLELNDNNFYMISGCGYPNYLNTIENSIEDIISNNIDALLIVIVDAEDFTYQEKYDEINDYIISKFSQFTNYEIIVQTPSIEGWCLGNKKFISDSPQSLKLRELIQHYNVRSDDPELLHPYENDNKAQTSTKYLKEAAKEKNVRYSKTKPDSIADISYLSNLRKRNDTTGHIGSFKKFIDIFDC